MDKTGNEGKNDKKDRKWIKQGMKVQMTKKIENG